MGKIITSIATISLILISSGYANDITKLNVREVCNVEKNGIDKVLNLAVKYNPIAVKKGLEFKRLGMTNTQYIAAIKDALKTNKKTITLLDKKGKKTKNKLSIENATSRACKFAISALTQDIEAQSSWKLAVPGTGYKY